MECVYIARGFPSQNRPGIAPVSYYCAFLYHDMCVAAIICRCIERGKEGGCVCVRERERREGEG